LFGEKVLLTDKEGVAIPTLADELALPPAPVHVRVYVKFPAALGITLSLPLDGGVPLQAPLAMQEVAFMEDQVRVKG
jgi:hypothetical protein